MWCELPQAWTQSFKEGKRLPSKSGKWVQGGGKRKGYFLTAQSGKAAEIFAAKDVLMGHIWASWVRHLDLSVSSCYKTLLSALESQMREKLEHSHISAPTQYNGFSQAQFWAAHDKILDTWFLFSQSTTRSWKCLCFKTSVVLVSSLLIFTRKPFITALM